MLSILVLQTQAKDTSKSDSCGLVVKASWNSQISVAGKSVKKLVKLISVQIESTYISRLEIQYRTKFFILCFCNKMLSSSTIYYVHFMFISYNMASEFRRARVSCSTHYRPQYSQYLICTVRQSYAQKTGVALTIGEKNLRLEPPTLHSRPQTSNSLK